MAMKLQIHLVEAALLKLLNERLKISYGRNVSVEPIGGKDFDEDGQLVLKSPAVRLRFAGANYDTLRDIQRLTMEGALTWDIICFEESLKSQHDERTKTLELVAAVQDEIAGARLEISPKVYTQPTVMSAVNPVMDAIGPVDQCYAVNIIINGIAQFSGTNANFGAK
jgi:hypothetical protein